MTRPGGSNLTGGETYMEALQNRNKTNLLDVLGVGPPPLPVMEYQEQDTPNLTSIAINKSIDFLKKATGIDGFLSDLQATIHRPMQMRSNRLWLTLETKFLPLKQTLRQILVKAESMVLQSQNASLYSVIGGAMGSIYGPMGSLLGSVSGALFGGWLESIIPIDLSVGDEYERNYPGWKPPEFYDLGGVQLPRGGAPDYSQLLTPTERRRHPGRMAAKRREQILLKVRNIMQEVY